MSELPGEELEVLKMFIDLTVDPIGFGLKTPPCYSDTPEVSSLPSQAFNTDMTHPQSAAKQLKSNLHILFSSFLWETKVTALQ